MNGIACPSRCDWTDRGDWIVGARYLSAVINSIADAIKGTGARQNMYPGAIEAVCILIDVCCIGIACHLPAIVDAIGSVTSGSFALRIEISAFLTAPQRAARRSTGTPYSVPSLTSPLPTGRPLAVPYKRRRFAVPMRGNRLEPGHDLLGLRRMLSR